MLTLVQTVVADPETETSEEPSKLADETPDELTLPFTPLLNRDSRPSPHQQGAKADTDPARAPLSALPPHLRHRVSQIFKGEAKDRGVIAAQEKLCLSPVPPHLRHRASQRGSMATSGPDTFHLAPAPPHLRHRASKSSSKKENEKRAVIDAPGLDTFQLATAPPPLINRTPRLPMEGETEDCPQKQDPQDHGDRLPLRAHPPPSYLPPHLRKKLPEMSEDGKNGGQKR